MGRPRDLEIQVVRAEGRGGPARSALQVRDDDGTGPLTRGSGRMGSKDPAGISGFTSRHLTTEHLFVTIPQRPYFEHCC